MVVTSFFEGVGKAVLNWGLGPTCLSRYSTTKPCAAPDLASPPHLCTTPAVCRPPCIWHLLSQQVLFGELEALWRASCVQRWELSILTGALEQRDFWLGDFKFLCCFLALMARVCAQFSISSLLFTSLAPYFVRGFKPSAIKV